MKGIIILAVLASVAIASPALNVCEQKNEVLGNALQNFAIKNIPKDLRADCQTCYDDILLAVADCFGSASWLQCIEDILGAGNPCIDCVCEVINDICGIFGCDWSC